MAQNTYLEAKVLTAPPHRLQLMLIEGAIRYGRQAEQALRRADDAAASPAILRLVDLIGEMLAGVRRSQTELNQKIANLYSYLLRQVAEAKLHTNADALVEVLELLEYERQTWQMVCDRLGSAPHESARAADHASGARSPAPNMPLVSPTTSEMSPGISLEA